MVVVLFLYSILAYALKGFKRFLNFNLHCDKLRYLLLFHRPNLGRSDILLVDLIVKGQFLGFHNWLSVYRRLHCKTYHNFGRHRNNIGL